MRSCEWCGCSIITTRADARYCSGAHRVAAHRAGKKIPTEMLERSRWIRRTAKKVPLTVDGQPASSTDPTTWATYAQALESPAGVGLGYVLGDGIGCIDIDHCLTNGQPNLAAEAFLANYPNHWIERSPSGDGLHIWGTLEPGPGTKRHLAGLNVETYSTGRYITITGDTYQRGTLLPL